MRRLVAETTLAPHQLVLPMFVREGARDPRPVPSMPDVVQHTRDTLRKAALEAGEAQADEWKSFVRLMTLHSAKGLEFPLVIIAGMEEGLFPHQKSVDAPGRLEEERRLCYVGITRARQWLTLSYSASRAPGGRQRRPSRFLPVDDAAPGRSARGRGSSRDADGTRRRVISVPCRVCGAVLMLTLGRYTDLTCVVAPRGAAGVDK